MIICFTSLNPLIKLMIVLLKVAYLMLLKWKNLTTRKTCMLVRLVPRPNLELVRLIYYSILSIENKKKQYKTVALKRYILLELPQTLIINLKRFT